MRNIIGFIIVLLGFGLLLQQFSIPGLQGVMKYWWPLLLIAGGVYAWFMSRGSKTGPVIIMLVGAILLLDQLDILTNSAWGLFWPALLIFVGWRLIMGRTWSGDQVASGPAESMAMFSGVDRKVTGPVTNSEVSAWFGGVKIDMREAEFPESVALNVFAAFGGIELLVPKNVKVITKVLPLFGGADDKSQPDSATTKTLTIHGTVLFGGVSVKN